MGFDPAGKCDTFAAMKLRVLAGWALLGLGLLEPVAAAGIFMDPSSAAITAVLPQPPADGSLAAAADLETVLEVQAYRTPAEVKWAQRIDKDSLFDYADVLGPWFTAANLPFTAEFFKEEGKDLQAVSERIKGLYARPRPPAVDPRVHPCIPIPSSFSYPSGHSLRAMSRALLLAEIFPEHREELLAWARRAGWSRVIGGVHFPTDVMAGRLLAEAFVSEVLKNRSARAALEHARAEAEPFLSGTKPVALKPAA